MAICWATLSWRERTSVAGPSKLWAQRWRSVRRVDQLRGDADAVAGADDGALDDGVDVELAGDLGERTAARPCTA